MKTVPVYLLSGFLGSGKTTLLTQMLDFFKENNMKPAVVMNELGDINLDGELVSKDVPMAEMLSGCICCTMQGDLGVEISQLIDRYSPDAVIIESTGAANPLETIDGVTEIALYKHIELCSIITVVDGPELLARRKNDNGETYQLMLDQIRTATMLLLNKVDLLEQEQLIEAQQLLRETNQVAQIVPTVKCKLENLQWLGHKSNEVSSNISNNDISNTGSNGQTKEGTAATIATSIVTATTTKTASPINHNAHNHAAHHHVSAVTYYVKNALHSEGFEKFLEELPPNIYRAKGVIRFSDTGGRYLFQYAYKQSDFMRIDPQGEVNDVVVFIGEHFSKEDMLSKLSALDAAVGP